MVRVNKFLLGGLTFVLSIAVAGASVAIENSAVGLVGGWNVTWDILKNPTSSPSVDIQIQNATSSSAKVFNGYDLGLKFVRISGSGDIKLGNASNPSGNSIVPAWLYDSPVSGASQGEDTVWNVALDKVDVAVPDMPTDIVTLDFTTGTDAPTKGSVFQVLSDCTLSDYVPYGQKGVSYANNASNDFLLGTITVVPEPSSIALLGVAGAIVVISIARRSGTRGLGSSTCPPLAY